MKIIEWAFLCASVVKNNLGGLDIINLGDTFHAVSTSNPFLVYRTAVPVKENDEVGPYRLFGTFDLGLRIKTKTDEEIEAYATEILVAPKAFVLPVGKSPLEPGSYTIELFADGDLQHTLDLFLL